MANYATLKAAIADTIKTNGANAITGALLQQQLLAIVNSLGANYQFAGVATPATNPGTPDQNVMYFAATPGTYPNFNNFKIDVGVVSFFTYNGSWSKYDVRNDAFSAINAMGVVSNYINGYVNTVGTINQDGTGQYKTLVARVDQNKKYKYFCSIANPGGGVSNFYYAFLNESFSNAEDGAIHYVMANEWVELESIPENAAYMAMTIQFGQFSATDDYTKCAIVEESAYFKYLEGIPIFDKDLKMAPFSDATMDKTGVSQTLLNKALTYVTPLGTTGRYYNGYINSSNPLHPIAFDGDGVHKVSILRVLPGKTYRTFIYYNMQSYTSNYRYVGAIAFYDENFDYVADSYIENGYNKNGWNDVVAPDGSYYMAVTLELNYDGNYKNCCIIEASEYNKLIQSICDTVGIKNLIDSDFVKYNGYVTSSSIGWAVNFQGTGEYKVAIIPVKPGETLIYEIGSEMDSNCLSLVAFSYNYMGTGSKLGNNLSLHYGKNEIVVPTNAYFLCATLSFGNTPYDNAKIYKKNTLVSRVEQLEQAETGGGMVIPPRVLVKKDGLNLYIATDWDDNYYLVQRMVAHRDMGVSDGPSDANLIDIRKVLKTSDLSDAGSYLKSAGDDICPANMNGSYIGGNHGWNHTVIVNAPSHGKTIADVGAEYKDSGQSNKKFYILRIIDADSLLMISENGGSEQSYPFYSFALPVGPLVYSANGNSGSNIVVSSTQNLGNFYGSCSEAKYTLVGDNGRIIDDGIYNVKEFSLIEEYDILDLPSVVNALYSNRPSGGYAEQPVFQNLSGVQKLAHRSVSYKFLPNGTCVVGTSLFAYKNLALSFDGVVQSINGGNKMYVPKLKPYVHDGVTYDFANIENWASFYGQTFPNTYWENVNNAPDRAVNFSTSSKMSIMLGYILDRGVETDRKTICASGHGALYLASSLKLYPMALSDDRTMTPGDNYSVVAYRAVTNIEKNPNGRTNYAAVKVNNETFVFVDYHGSLIDILPIQDDWIGKKIAVVEKTDNITLLTTDCVGGPIGVQSAATSSSYGYIVLKLYD